jgi:two-component system response regulator
VAERLGENLSVPSRFPFYRTPIPEMPSRSTDVTIVVAEDDPDDRMLAEEALEEAGISNPVVWVKDGVELLQWLGENREGRVIVLLDINMPRMDGHEALEKIRERERGAVVVVMLTTSDQEEDVVRSYDLGVNSYLRKPLDPEDFSALATRFKNYWLKQSTLPGR